MRNTDAFEEHCYLRYIRRAVRLRNNIRSNPHLPELHSFWRGMMRFWSTLAVKQCSGFRGPIHNPRQPLTMPPFILERGHHQEAA